MDENKFDLKNCNTLVLAYLGDAVIELEVREKLVKNKCGDVGQMNKLSRAYVQASSQSAAIERVLPHLTEEELEIYKRGRNAHTQSHPKHASIADYRRATGFETLMGKLYIEGKKSRIKELFSIAYPDEEI